ncbi:hypothetical protein LUZ60_011833 [Juncus effusus]|nr:hypothetical protein LUZ60_011833 [Juncus effusus]
MAMKVLNWIHRKLNVRDDYSPISPLKDETKEDTAMRGSITERDTEALLLHDILLNGILTIGTLGHDQSFLPQEDIVLEVKEQKELQIDNGEKKNEEISQITELPAVESKPLSRVESVKMKSSSVKGCEFNEMMDLVVKKLEFEEERVSTQEKPLLMNEETREIKTRTTLAELFAAEAFVEKEEKGEINGVLEVKNCEDKKKMEEMNKKTKKEEKCSTAMNNTRKFNRLMRKMLRKKIYPEHLNGTRGKEVPITSS